MHPTTRQGPGEMFDIEELPPRLPVPAAVASRGRGSQA